MKIMAAMKIMKEIENNRRWKENEEGERKKSSEISNKTIMNKQIS